MEIPESVSLEDAFVITINLMKDVQAEKDNLEEMLLIAGEALLFYGNCSNWLYSNLVGVDGSISICDLSLPNEYKKTESGGKLARKTIKQISETINNIKENK